MMFQSKPRPPLTMRQSGEAGFTLIELMIVVAVVAILATIAMPSYNEHVRKARRAQAKADISEYMQLAERYHTVNNTYVGFALPRAFSPREAASAASAHYGIAINPAATANAITITAVPRAGSGQAQDRCGSLSINQASVKTNSSGSLTDCW